MSTNINVQYLRLRHGVSLKCFCHHGAGWRRSTDTCCERRLPYGDSQEGWLGIAMPYVDPRPQWVKSRAWWKYYATLNNNIKGEWYVRFQDILVRSVSNTYGPEHYGFHFANDIVKCILSNTWVWISIQISQKFAPKGSIDNMKLWSHRSGSGNGMALNWQKAITWTNTDLWCHIVSLSHNE